MKSSKSMRKILAVTLSTLLLLSASFTLLSQDISVDTDAVTVVKSKDGQKYDENHNIVLFVGEQGVVLGGYAYDYIVTGDWQIKSGDSIKMVKSAAKGCIIEGKKPGISTVSGWIQSKTYIVHKGYSMLGSYIPGWTEEAYNTTKTEQKVRVVNLISTFLFPKSLELDVKKSYTIDTGTDDPYTLAANGITFTSSAPDIVSVSEMGVVTAMKKGNATITLTLGENEASFPVKVSDPSIIDGIKLSKTATTLGKGESINLKATFIPANATNKKLTWTTTNSKVVTVSNGTVKAVGNGTATVTAKTANGKTASCKITVKNAPSKVTITKTALTIGVGEKFTLGSGIDANAGCATRTFRTSNSSIVKMTRTDWQGDLTGVKPGTAYVTVKTYNGKEATCKVTVKAAPPSVKISKGTLTLKVGQTGTLSSTVPNNTGCAQRKYRTSNSSVLKMTKTDWTASFKALKPGTAYVTVRTFNGKESTCKVTVVK